jgi:hypothetical protein
MMMKPNEVVTKDHSGKLYLDKRQKFLVKSIRDLWLSISWLDFNKKAKIVKYFQLRLKNSNDILDDLSGLILEEQCQFFEQITIYYIRSTKNLNQTDFLSVEGQANELNETKARIQDIGDQLTDILKKFTLFCQEELKDMQESNCSSNLLIVFLDVILAQGNSKKRFLPNRIKTLGHGLFPNNTLYKSLEFVSTNTSSKKFSPSGYPECLGFLLASRVLSNIEEKEDNPLDLSALKPSLYGQFFAFCSALLEGFFLGTCFNNHSLGSSFSSTERENNGIINMSKIGQNSDKDFLQNFFRKHEKLLFTHEDKTNLLLVNFAASILFSINSISVIGQIKQKVSKTIIVDQTASETDKLIARQTLLFEQISKNVNFFVILGFVQSSTIIFRILCHILSISQMLHSKEFASFG